MYFSYSYLHKETKLVKNICYVVFAYIGDGFTKIKLKKKKKIRC